MARPRLDSTPGRAGARRARVRAIVRRVALPTLTLAGVCGSVLALRRIGFSSIGRALTHSSPGLVLVALGVMCSAMVMRAVSWQALLRAALPDAGVRVRDALRGVSIGVLVSSALPARLGEPARAMVIARRTERPGESLPTVVGTLLSQTLINFLALGILGAISLTCVPGLTGRRHTVLAAALIPAVFVTLLLCVPLVRRLWRRRSADAAPLKVLVKLQAGLGRLREGLRVLREPRHALPAVLAQLSAWALQWLSCLVLLSALGVGHHAGVTAAAAVLFFVNVSAAIPATPGNLGVFQAACAATLHAGWHVPYGDGVAYGVTLQAVEVGTAVAMGLPSFLREGMSWRQLRRSAGSRAPAPVPPQRHGPGPRPTANPEPAGAS